MKKYHLLLKISAIFSGFEILSVLSLLAS